MLQRDGVVMVEMKVLVMMMMIPMKSSAMVMIMATISSLREEISSTDFCLPESFSLSVFSALQRRQCLSLIPPLDLGFQGRQHTRGALAEVGQGGLTPGWCGQGLTHATWWCGPPAAPFALSFCYFHLLIIYEFLDISLELLIFRNMVS
jgi:hypothetical protein